MADILEFPEQSGKWFVVQVRPNCTSMAERNLVRQGFEVFSPFEEVSIRRSGSYRIVRKHLFPGYIFVGIDPDTAPWRSINSTYGVSRLVAFAANRPAPVPTDMMCGLMLRCDASGKLLPPEALKEGDRVRIASGPLGGFIARVEKVPSRERAWILMDIMGISRRVAVSTSDLHSLD